MRVTTMTPPLNIEDVLCSRVRLRILKLLADSDRFTVSDIAAKTGVNYASAKAHLETLEGEDVLSHVMFGKRIRYYKLKGSARATAVKAFREAFQQQKL